MKKANVDQHPLGSAEHVIAHAAWQRSRGRKPSMSYLGEKNPSKALKLAKSVVHGFNERQKILRLADRMVKASKKTYKDMTDAEIKIVARAIIATSNSEREVRDRLERELNYPYSIAITSHLPKDATGHQARDLCRALGGLTMKNGAMVMVMMHGHDDTISL